MTDLFESAGELIEGFIVREQALDGCRSIEGEIAAAQTSAIAHEPVAGVALPAAQALIHQYDGDEFDHGVGFASSSMAAESFSAVETISIVALRTS